MFNSDRSEYSLMRLSYGNFLQTFPRVTGWAARYGMAVLSTGVVLIICLFLDQVLSGSLPLTLFIIPVAISAMFGGLGPGLLATLLSGLASEYFLTEPHFSLYSMDTADFERLALFLTTSALLCWMIKTTQIARQAVESRALEAEQRQRELEAQIAERERARAERERLIAELEMERARLKASVEEEKRAREALRLNQERLNLAQKASRTGSFEWNIQTNAVMYSEEGEALFGLAPGSFGGSYEDWTKCLHPEDRPRAEQEVWRATVDGEGASEYRVVWPDGAIHWLNWRGKGFLDEVGGRLGMMVGKIDVIESDEIE